MPSPMGDGARGRGTHGGEPGEGGGRDLLGASTIPTPSCRQPCPVHGFEQTVAGHLGRIPPCRLFSCQVQTTRRLGRCGGGGCSAQALGSGTPSPLLPAGDRVNCPFYYKMGACRHGDKCSRIHNRPVLSQTLLIPHMCPAPRPGGHPQGEDKGGGWGGGGQLCLDGLTEPPCRGGGVGLCAPEVAWDRQKGWPPCPGGQQMSQGSPTLPTHPVKAWNELLDRSVYWTPSNSTECNGSLPRPPGRRPPPSQSHRRPHDHRGVRGPTRGALGAPPTEPHPPDCNQRKPTTTVVWVSGGQGCAVVIPYGAPDCNGVPVLFIRPWLRGVAMSTHVLWSLKGVTKPPNFSAAAFYPPKALFHTGVKNITK